ncbi:MAG: FtsQ-type POTRA domain-containing protein [Gaiellaceae bacterium]
MVGGRSERGARRRTRAASVVVPFPRDDAGARQALARIVPSGRSLLVGLGLLLGALGAYWVALTSSLFAVEGVTVQGAAPASVSRDVERATADLVGTSLLSVDEATVEGVVRALPSVAGVSVDRAFPHTLVVKVAAERPVGVARQGSSAWLVAASGKVIRELERGTERTLPRIWLAKDVPVAVGRTLPVTVVPATRAVGMTSEAGLRRGVKAARIVDGQLTLVLRNGPELRLGTPSDVLLKLTVAARVLPLLESGAVYLDVSVPERPVSSIYLNP